MENLSFREISEIDNPKIASLIRNVLEDYDVARPGTVYTDPTTDDLFKLFQSPKSIYWIAEVNGKIAGGCGIYPTLGLPSGYGELVKLYVKTDLAGKGLGKKLMGKAIKSASALGYTNLYLETMPELSKAIGLYEKMQFKLIDEQLGSSGHFACEIRMVRSL